MAQTQAMSPTQSRAFYAVATQGSFTAAARSLNVSQPTVTTQVKELETLYGVELFHRHARGVFLTDTGRELLGIIRRMYARQQDAVEYLRAVQGLQTGSLRIGAYGPYDVIEILAEFNRRHPGLDVSLGFANSTTLQEELLNHTLDVAVFGSLESRSEFHTLAYSRSPLVVIVAKTHRWGRRKSIRMHELNGERLIVREPGAEARRAFEEAMGQAGLDPDDVMEIGSREGIVAAVARGIGVGTICDVGALPEQSVSKLAIADVHVVNHVDIVCLAERKGSRIIGAFLETAGDLRSAGA